MCIVRQTLIAPDILQEVSAILMTNPQRATPNRRWTAIASQALQRRRDENEQSRSVFNLLALIDPLT